MKIKQLPADDNSNHNGWEILENYDAEQNDAVEQENSDDPNTLEPDISDDAWASDEDFDANWEKFDEGDWGELSEEESSSNLEPTPEEFSLIQERIAAEKAAKECQDRIEKWEEDQPADFKEQHPVAEANLREMITRGLYGEDAVKLAEANPDLLATWLEDPDYLAAFPSIVSEFRASTDILLASPDEVIEIYNYRKKFDSILDSQDTTTSDTNQDIRYDKEGRPKSRLHFQINNNIKSRLSPGSRNRNCWTPEVIDSAVNAAMALFNQQDNTLDSANLCEIEALLSGDHERPANPKDLDLCLQGFTMLYQSGNVDMFGFFKGIL